MSATDFLAVDWGTTNRRVYKIATDGAVRQSQRDNRGVLAIRSGGYADEVAAIRRQHGDLPMLLAGMVGSSRGWVDVPYLPCPADLSTLARSLHWIDRRTAIVPGLRCMTNGRADVMRGEEVQLLGAIAAGLTPADALLCQPGTHCKWAQVASGTIAGFHTTMTGELLALLRGNGLLAEFLTDDVKDGPDYRAGLADAQNDALLSRLFGARAAVLVGARSAADTASYVSGLLIGTDVREQRLARATHVHLLAKPPLDTLYHAAIEAVGGRVSLVDSDAAFVAGIAVIWEMQHAAIDA